MLNKIYKFIFGRFGITENESHGYIAAFIILFLSMYHYFVLDKTFCFSLLLGINIATLLQALNESIQAIDPDIQFKYKTWINFQNNSREDWSYFLKGSLIAIVLFLLSILVMAIFRG